MPELSTDEPIGLYGISRFGQNSEEPISPGLRDLRTIYSRYITLLDIESILTKIFEVLFIRFLLQDIDFDASNGRPANHMTKL